MDWLKVVIVIAIAMLLLWLAPGWVMVFSGVAGWVISALVTLWVYSDARSRGMPQAGVLVWTVLTFVSGFFAHQYSLVVFLLYLIGTRGR